MAIVTVSMPFDMTTISLSLLWGNIDSYSTTAITVNVPPPNEQTVIFLGAFTYSPLTGGLLGGNITDIGDFVQGSAWFTIEGLSIDVNQFVSFINQNTNLDAINYVMSGVDSIVGSYGADVLAAGGGNDTIRGGTGNDTLIGNTEDDVIYGNQGDDLVWGDGSFSGNDVLYGGQGADTIDGGGGIDAIYGNLGNDIIGSTGAGSMALYGGQGEDYMQGNTGSDLFFGNLGNDYMYGGGGASDTYVFGNDFGADTIQGYGVGFDKIEMRGSTEYQGAEAVNGGTILHFTTGTVFLVGVASATGIEADIYHQ